MSKIIQDCISFALLGSLIGQKTHTTLSHFWLTLCKFSLAPTGNFPSPDWLLCLLLYWFYNIQSNSTLSVNKPNLSIYHFIHTNHLERFFFFFCRGCPFSILHENKGQEVDEANLWQSQQRKLQVNYNDQLVQYLPVLFKLVPFDS